MALATTCVDSCAEAFSPSCISRSASKKSVSFLDALSMSRATSLLLASISAVNTLVRTSAPVPSASTAAA